MGYVVVVDAGKKSMKLLAGRPYAALRGFVVVEGGGRRGYSVGRHRCRFRDRSRGRSRSRCIGSSRCSRGLFEESAMVVVVLRGGSYPVSDLFLPYVVAQMTAVVVVEVVLLLLVPVRLVAGDTNFANSGVKPVGVGCGRDWGMGMCCMDWDGEADIGIVGRWHLLIARMVVVVVAAA